MLFKVVFNPLVLVLFYNFLNEPLPNFCYLINELTLKCLKFEQDDYIAKNELIVTI